MRSIYFALLALALCMTGAVSAGEPFRTVQIEEGTVLPSRCHMGECAWSRIIATRVQVRPNQALNVEVVQALGSSSQDTPDDIQWDGANTSFVTCSYAQPKVSFTADGTLNEHFLTLSPQGTVYGYQVGSAITYFLACHNLRINESGIEDAIARFGYDVISDE